MGKLVQNSQGVNSKGNSCFPPTPHFFAIQVSLLPEGTNLNCTKELLMQNKCPHGVLMWSNYSPLAVLHQLVQAFSLSRQTLSVNENQAFKKLNTSLYRCRTLSKGVGNVGSHTHTPLIWFAGRGMVGFICSFIRKVLPELKLYSVSNEKYHCFFLVNSRCWRDLFSDSTKGWLCCRCCDGFFREFVLPRCSDCNLRSL